MEVIGLVVLVVFLEVLVSLLLLVLVLVIVSLFLLVVVLEIIEVEDCGGEEVAEEVVAVFAEEDVHECGGGRCGD